MSDDKQQTEAALARVGQRVAGRYRLTRLLGFGGMASVYEAACEAGSGAEGGGPGVVAVKILHPTYTPTCQRQQRLWREARVAKAVIHPGVVRIHETGIDPELGAYLIMELLVGQTLGKLQHDHRGKLPIERIYHLGDALLDALAAVHAAGFIHRDLKPDNVFVTDEGLKILDFGVARTTDAGSATSINTQAGMMLGTPAFMSQEQARGCWDEVDARSDIWAAGATLFSLATGRHVHEGKTTNEQLGRAMTTSAPSLASVDASLPAGFAKVVDRALRFEPGDRWQSAVEMRQALQAAARGEPVGGPTYDGPADGVHTVEAARRSEPNRPAGFRPGLRTAALVLLAVAALVLALFTGRARDASGVVRHMRAAIIAAPAATAPAASAVPSLEAPAVEPGIEVDVAAELANVSGGSAASVASAGSAIAPAGRDSRSAAATSASTRIPGGSASQPGKGRHGSAARVRPPVTKARSQRPGGSRAPRSGSEPRHSALPNPLDMRY